LAGIAAFLFVHEEEGKTREAVAAKVTEEICAGDL
jgi:hypothetical protein